MKNLLLLSVIPAGMLFSCGPSMTDLAIDNPGNDPIIVTIDELTVEVPGRQVAWVEMGKGEHQVKLENDSVFKYNFSGKLYFLNPTRTSYLKSEATYGSPAYKTMSVVPNKKVVYLGMEIEGNFDVLSDLVMPITWDYGPREKLPESVELDQDEPYATFIKISDPMEIMEEIYASSKEEDL